MADYKKEIEQLMSKQIYENVKDALSSKGMTTFMPYLYWHSSSKLYGTIRHWEPGSRSYDDLQIRFVFELSKLLDRENAGYRRVDYMAGLTDAALDDVTRALLRVLWVTLLGCMAVGSKFDAMSRDEKAAIESAEVSVDPYGAVVYAFVEK